MSAWRPVEVYATFLKLTGEIEVGPGQRLSDEINRVTAGSNGGWVQLTGPAGRVAEFKQIETTFTPTQGNLGYSASDRASFIPALQQLRWDPANTADTRLL